MIEKLWQVELKTNAHWLVVAGIMIDQELKIENFINDLLISFTVIWIYFLWLKHYKKVFWKFNCSYKKVFKRNDLEILVFKT